MPVIELPDGDGELNRFGLTEQSRLVRNLAVTGPQTTNAIIGITSPFSTPITKGLIGDDTELAAFWAAEKGRFRYDYLTFRCSFEPADRPIDKAWIEVALDPKADGGPIAWSMAPAQVTDKQTLTESAKLTGAFKLVSGEVAATKEMDVNNWVVRSRMGQPTTPYWEFQATESTPLDGDFKLQIVVRTAASLLAKGRITARAVIAAQTFLLFTLEAAREQSVGVDFELKPQP
jgi:hypothetical protein